MRALVATGNQAAPLELRDVDEPTPTQNSPGEESTVSFGSFAGRAHAKLYAFFVYESGEPPTFGADLAMLAGEIGAGRLKPEVGLQASWRNPAEALDALRQRKLGGKAILVID